MIMILTVAVLTCIWMDCLSKNETAIVDAGELLDEVTTTSITTETFVTETTSTTTITTTYTKSTITTVSENTTMIDTTTSATISSIVSEMSKSRNNEYIVNLVYTTDEEYYDDSPVEEYSPSEEYIEEEETSFSEPYIEETTTTTEYESYEEEESYYEEYYDEECDTEYEYTQLPITESERILLCNLVGREYGSDYISTYEKAKVVAVVMNRVRAGSDAGFADTIYDVLTQPYQFSGYYVCYEYTYQVTDDVASAVDYYFAHPEEFSTDIYYFYGDGYYNYFY